MAVTNAMYIFEVVVQSVNSMIRTTNLVIRSDFADVFSLELKDPKQMHIVLPEPPPLPPEPPGKKKKAKPNNKKGKKKKGEEEAPPPEPVIQAGQSVLFTSSAELLTQNMKKFPMEISLWNKEDYMEYIGSVTIAWDPIFFKYLETLYNCLETPPVTLNEEYNVFEEGTAKLIAKIRIQIKLSYLGEKVTAAFRTLSEDPVIKKVLYTGVNSKTTSYMCTMKTTDDVFEENCNKIENNFIIDKPKPTRIAYADYKNAPGAKYIFTERDYCCMNNADKPPKNKYKAPETCPDIDFIIEYVRKIITSCYDNMRMLTPRPTIRPRIKATDIDRLCYCKETRWPENEIAQRFKKEVQSQPCPLCTTSDDKTQANIEVTKFDIANIRGPCGRHDCKVARHIRAYIENLVEEDDKEITINDIIGVCGSKDCTLAETIQQFLRSEGVFKEMNTLEGLSTQCACIQRMRDSMNKTKFTVTSDSTSSSSETSDSEKSNCGKKNCPFGKNIVANQVFTVFYFFVQYELDDKSSKSSPNGSNKSHGYEYCASECPSTKTLETKYCSRSACSINTSTKNAAPSRNVQNVDSVNDPSPDDSNIVIDFDKIQNPCSIKSCNVVDTVKDIIIQGVNSKKKVKDEDPCYCDCECSLNFSNKTTYCAVCGGYECLGDDLKDIPDHAKPYPCPVYNNLYDKKYIKVQNPWPEEEVLSLKQLDNISVKSSKTIDRKSTRSVKSVSERRLQDRRSDRSDYRVTSSQKVKKRPVQEKKQKEPRAVIPKVDKIVAAVPAADKLLETIYPYPPVPKNMGWLWNAEDIPGLKFRPKWRPGAANKILVHRYRAIREGVDIIAKKRKALLQRKKKLEMKPTLVVKKKNGDYTVQMEVLKKYSKERLIFQYPYDEKPPLIYTIGKTEQEKTKIQRQRERRERRETRRKCRLLQSSFRDKCQEICVKAYNQAIGLLPLPDPNKPECPCYSESVRNLTPPIDSCSCSEEEVISSSDTDNDDWIIEFTPPLARWDAKAKHPPILSDNECQYNYLDYKVKVLDKSGNPVPRFFKGPDGKQECSDLGGFWDPNHVWMEINKDGYIGPDNRWVPMNFTGPDGMFYSSEEGVFTDNTGRTLKIGVDGYIDKDGKWAWYFAKKLQKSIKSKTLSTAATGDSRGATVNKTQIKDNSNGDFKKPEHNKMKDKLHQKIGNSIVTKTANAKVSKFGFNYSKTNNPLIMNVSVGLFGHKKLGKYDFRYIVDQNKLRTYNEVMKNIYDDSLGLNLLTKSDRASNNLRKKPYPFVAKNILVKSNSIKSNVICGSKSPVSEIC